MKNTILASVLIKVYLQLQKFKHISHKAQKLNSNDSTPIFTGRSRAEISVDVVHSFEMVGEWIIYSEVPVQLK